MTPEVKKAIQDRQERYEELQKFKVGGFLGEDNQGYISILQPGAGEALVNGENADRRLIYKTIVQQNNLDPKELTTVQRAFAEIRRDKALQGEYFQDNSGKWRQKG